MKTNSTDESDKIIISSSTSFRGKIITHRLIDYSNARSALTSTVHTCMVPKARIQWHSPRPRGTLRN
jgi:hypothetical protein